MSLAPDTDPTREALRLNSLRMLDVLDSADEPAFDALVKAASLVCGVPISLISLVDEHRQWFKANLGLPGVDQTPRDVAFCAHAIGGDELFEVPDATRDARFAGNPLVTGQPDIRFYAGAPLVLADGQRVGTLCVIDRQPRLLDDQQRETLRCLAVATVALLETRRAARQQQLAASALAISETRFRALAEGAPIGIYALDTDGRNTYANQACRQIYGGAQWPNDTADWRQALHPDDRTAVVAAWRHCLATQGDFEMDFRLRWPDGTVRQVHSSARPVNDHSQVLTGYVGSLTDVTAERDNLALLAASQQRLRRLFDATPAMLHSIDAQGRLLSVSDRWLATMGYTRAEVIGRPSSDFLTEASRRHAREVVIPQFFATGRCDLVPYQMVTKSGAILDVLLSAMLEQDGQLHGARSVAILEDVTLRLRAEADSARARQAMADSEARYRAIVEDQTELISLAQTDGSLRFVNQAYARHFGRSPAQMVGTNLLDYVAPDDRDAVQQHLAQVAAGEQALVGVNISPNAQGELRWVAWTNRPITEVDEGGGVQRLIHSVGRDITAQRRSELDLQASLRERDTLLREVYHRVKNNLQMVQSLMSLHRRTVPDGTARQVLDDCVQQVRAMALVHEKLYQHPSLAAIALADYTSDLLRQIGEASGAAERRIRLVPDIADVQAALDVAVPYGMLVTELVVNSLKHGFADGRSGEIRVTVRPSDGGLHLQVADTGVSLPDDFDLSRTMSLGLKLASSLAAQLGGQLQARSDQGAVFSAVLTRLS